MTREEAIKIVQSAIWTDEEKDALAMLIPELAESEDERIRKWIIAEIKATHDYDSPTSRKCVDDALAYLEKQGEQKVSVDDFKAKDWYVSKVDGKIHNIYYSYVGNHEAAEALRKLADMWDD